MYSPPYAQEHLTKDERTAKVRMLYEEYISLHPVKAVWDNPVTSKPRLEPLFAAGMQGIELCFVLMAQFISDPRHYVVKRPRVELVAEDICKQCQLVRVFASCKP